MKNLHRLPRKLVLYKSWIILQQRWAFSEKILPFGILTLVFTLLAFLHPMFGVIAFAFSLFVIAGTYEFCRYLDLSAECLKEDEACAISRKRRELNKTSEDRLVERAIRAEINSKLNKRS